jgi:hypothetical protein
MIFAKHLNCRAAIEKWKVKDKHRAANMFAALRHADVLENALHGRLTNSMIPKSLRIRASQVQTS